MTLMETAQLLGNFGEFVGAIGVVGTLVYLAVQIRQSKEALDANTRSLDENRNLTKADTIRQLTQRWDDITHRASESREAASIFVRGNSSLGDLDEVDQFIYIKLNIGGVHLELEQQAKPYIEFGNRNRPVDVAFLEPAVQLEDRRVEPRAP